MNFSLWLPFKEKTNKQTKKNMTCLVLILEQIYPLWNFTLNTAAFTAQ